LKPETPHVQETPHRGVGQLWVAIAGLNAQELRVIEPIAISRNKGRKAIKDWKSKVADKTKIDWFLCLLCV